MENKFTVSEEKNKLNLDFIHRELSTSYWAKNIPRELVQKAIDNSMCFGIYHDNIQIGFARVISDNATFAYLCDVIITASFRKQGAGKLLMSHIMTHPELQGLRKFSLGTLDAHQLYKRYGFTNLNHPKRLMEISRPDIYELKYTIASEKNINSKARTT